MCKLAKFQNYIFINVHISFYFFIHHFYSYMKNLTKIPSFPPPIPRIFTLIPCILTPIHHIRTLIPRIPIILTLIPRIPIIPTLIPRIPIIPTLITRILTLIPHIPLIPVPDSPFRLLQITWN